MKHEKKKCKTSSGYARVAVEVAFEVEISVGVQLLRKWVCGGWVDGG